MAEIEKVKLPNDDTIYDIKDAKAIRGLASGTTSGHVVQFGADGYTVGDSGKSMSDKQDTIDSSHKLSADLIDDTNATNKFATAAQLDQIETNKTNILLLERLNGKKNYFNNKAVSKTVGTLTFTVNDDKSITVSGSNSTSSAVVLYLSSSTFEYIPNNNIGKYLIGITDGSNSTYRLNIVYSDDGTSYTSEAYQTTSPYKIANKQYYEIQLSIASGYAFSEPKTFYPMIIDEATLNAGFTDYQPYALSNAGLTGEVAEEQAKTTGMTAGGTDYITVGGIRVYVSATAPTGARTGDLWIGG
jgi:hypothetical protein